MAIATGSPSTTICRSGDDRFGGSATERSHGRRNCTGSWYRDNTNAVTLDAGSKDPASTFHAAMLKPAVVALLLPLALAQAPAPLVVRDLDGRTSTPLAPPA